LLSNLNHGLHEWIIKHEYYTRAMHGICPRPVCWKLGEAICTDDLDLCDIENLGKMKKSGDTVMSSLKIRGVASQLAMQNSGITPPDPVLLYQKVWNLMEFNRTATQFFHTAPMALARVANLLHIGKNLFWTLNVMYPYEM
jgi:hypothetical protein